MKRWFYLYLTILSITFASPVLRADQSPPCYKEIQQTFFRQDLLVAGLSLYSVNQTIWINIYRDLQNGIQRIPFIVESLARAKNPNPLEPVFIPGVAAEILQQALYSEFARVLRFYANQGSNIIINENTIIGIFRYIWEQQYPQLEACMR